MRWGPNFGATTPTPPTGIALEILCVNVFFFKYHTDPFQGYCPDSFPDDSRDAVTFTIVIIMIIIIIAVIVVMILIVMMISRDLQQAAQEVLFLNF